MDRELTKAELVFIERMRPHVEAGKTIEEAAQAVLDRDRELLNMAVADNALGAAIRRGLAADIYHSIRRNRAIADAVDEAANEAASGRKHWR
jgi:hypothetical protein